MWHPTRPMPFDMPLKVNGSEITTAVWIEDANSKRVATIKMCDNDSDRAEAIKFACNAYPKLIEALQEIACLNDIDGNHHLALSGSYGMFDEPGSVRTARATLIEIENGR